MARNGRGRACGSRSVPVQMISPAWRSSSACASPGARAAPPTSAAPGRAAPGARRRSAAAPGVAEACRSAPALHGAHDQQPGVDVFAHHRFGQVAAAQAAQLASILAGTLATVNTSRTRQQVHRDRGRIRCAESATATARWRAISASPSGLRAGQRWCGANGEDERHPPSGWAQMSPGSAMSAGHPIARSARLLVSAPTCRRGPRCAGAAGSLVRRAARARRTPRTVRTPWSARSRRRRRR